MVNFFIFGGCVSRDTFELVKDAHILTGYVARQSLISANSVPETRINTANSPTNFNSRMVVGDINSSLFPTLRQKSNDSDVFLFDILSERLGVYRLQGGRYITNSAELSKSKLLGNFPYAKGNIHFGTSQHLELWKQGVQGLKDILIECGLFSKSIYIETVWTDHTERGNNVPKFRNWSALHANKLYEPYFLYLRKLGFRSVKPSPEVSFSDENHKWGSSQYHYQPEYYQEILAQVFDLISDK
ncbi:DUF6270 domain-containing protein [Glutamicibacter sp. FR1]|uniref:DUF6270 domain-containing protein n=1 Tax=Glutamicibacter sp. FR1 TaxID=3393744 RepID=UPI0039AEA025